MGIVAPNRPPKPKKQSDDKFAGAYVQRPQKGKHDWVYDLDITSMYPSVIRSLNISPETKVGKIQGWDAEKFIDKNNKKTYTITDKIKTRFSMNRRLASNEIQKEILNESYSGGLSYALPFGRNNYVMPLKWMSSGIKKPKFSHLSSNLFVKFII